MDRLAALFEQFSLPEIARMLRRTVFSGIAAGVVALGITALIGHLIVGAGICIGLALGLVNIRLVTRSVAKVNAQQLEKPTRALAGRTLTRLAVTTLVVIGLVVASVDLGIGTAGGIAIFYLILLVNLITSLLHQGPSGVAV